MEVNKELKSKMEKCVELFNEAYELKSQIQEEITKGLNREEFDSNIEDQVGNYLIDNEDVEGLIEEIENGTIKKYIYQVKER